MRHLIAHLMGVAADPPDSSSTKPYQRRRNSDNRDQRAASCLLARVRPRSENAPCSDREHSTSTIHAHPLLEPHIKQGADLACQQARIPLSQSPQPGQEAAQAIERDLHRRRRPPWPTGRGDDPRKRARRVRSQALTCSKSHCSIVPARSMRL
jgi:hypothetical protein